MNREDAYLLAWLEHLRATSEKIVAMRTEGKSRDLWLEDLALYTRVIEIVKKSLDVKQEAA